MKRLKKITSGIIAPFPIGTAPRAGEILLACLHGVKAMSTHPLPGLLCNPVDEAPGPDLHNPLVSRVQALLENKFDLIKQFLRANSNAFFPGRSGLTKVARCFKEDRRKSPAREPRQEAGLCAAGPTSAHRQQSLHDCTTLPECKLADTGTPTQHETDWIPLIKAAVPPGAPSAPARTLGCNASKCDARDETPPGAGDFDLAGNCVLCVGGRAGLYSEYRRLIEASGGSLLIYRGDHQSDEDPLPLLLAHADMVVCPVDCVNHHTYFTVKRYCKRSGKACVLLDRSGLPTFRKGVESLAARVVRSAAGGNSAQSMSSNLA
ncbi:DUF2325 domain-containing protein [Nitrosospira lacus]|uniref:DUF2325 domain-containing protein n=1 Tax=Nitrosospira lacus TaxID=1288494 RepID=UPI0013747D0B|nr:DUF2325 domain-containing protein [Nitrosospira lacus]